jgi:hypothetical protein
VAVRGPCNSSPDEARGDHTHTTYTRRQIAARSHCTGQPARYLRRQHNTFCAGLPSDNTRRDGGKQGGIRGCGGGSLDQLQSPISVEGVGDDVEAEDIVRDTNVLSFVEAKWGRLAMLRTLRVVHYYTDDVGLPWASPSLVMGWIKRPLGDRQPLGRSL